METDPKECLHCYKLLKLMLSCVFFLVPSDVLYPKNTCSAHSGVSAEVLCRGRDFVVSCYPSFFKSFCLITQNKFYFVVLFSLDVEIHTRALCDEKRNCIHHQSKKQFKRKEVVGFSLSENLFIVFICCYVGA